MARKVQIEILAGPGLGESKDIEQDTILVGRGSQCAMQIASPHVSRQQCELSWQGDQLVLENLGTVNVTYLNDRPIERVYVQDGDLITFCDTALRVRIPRAAPVEAPKTTAFPQGPRAASMPAAAPQRPPAPPPPAPPAPRPSAEPTFVQPMPPMMAGPGPGALSHGPPGPIYRPAPPPAPPPPAAQSVMAPPPPLPSAPARPPGPLPGGFGTGTGQHAAFRPEPPRPTPGPPPAGPPAYGNRGMGPSQGSAQPSMAGMAVMPGLGSPQGPSHPLPGPPSRMGPQPTQGQATAPPGPAPLEGSARRKKAKAQNANLRLIRNGALAMMGVVVLVCLVYVVIVKTAPKPTRGLPPATSVQGRAGQGDRTGQPGDPDAPKVSKDPVIDRGTRTDEELLVEAERLFGIGSTYLREYRFDCGNLALSKSYLLKSRGHFNLVDPVRWGPGAAQIDAKVQEAEGLLDQEFRKQKIAYVREKQSGRYDQAMENLDGIVCLFPERDDDRHKFARTQQAEIRRLMSGSEEKGPF